MAGQHSVHRNESLLKIQPDIHVSRRWSAEIAKRAKQQEDLFLDYDEEILEELERRQKEKEPSLTGPEHAISSTISRCNLKQIAQSLSSHLRPILFLLFIVFFVVMLLPKQTQIDTNANILSNQISLNSLPQALPGQNLQSESQQSKSFPRSVAPSRNREHLDGLFADKSKQVKAAKLLLLLTVLGGVVGNS